MRPVLLEMDGFASFRTHTRVDFDDADYFVLVGATGSGKSTIIDAITFALYGSVPRWDKENVVAPALAPSVTRGTVKLVFDAKGARYVAMREVRRNGSTGQVSVRTARLEKLTDPQALGLSTDETESLGAGKEAKDAVEALLGLDFNQFTKCVALPQGDVAEFLHAPASERQKILTKLLGIEIYAKIQQAANARAAYQNTRAETLEGTIAESLSGDMPSLEQAQARVAALAGLEERLEAALPDLLTAGAQVRDAEQQIGKLEAACAVLSTVKTPDGVTELDVRRQAAHLAKSESETALTEAEELDTAARSAVEAWPARSDLERVRTLHERHAACAGALSGLEQAAEKSKQAAEDAATKARASAVATKDADVDLEQAKTAELGASAKAEAEGISLGLLRDVPVPEGLDALETGLSGIQEQQGQAAAAVAEAQAALKGAQDRRDRSVDRGSLERARISVAAVIEQATQVGRLSGETVTSKAKHAVNDATAETAEEHRAAAAIALEHAKASDTALALRPHLIAGEACPVCEQVVDTLPPPGVAADIATCQEALRLAEEAKRGADGLAQAALLKASGDEQALVAARATLQAEHKQASEALAALNSRWTLAKVGGGTEAEFAQLFGQASSQLEGIREITEEAEASASSCKEAERQLGLAHDASVAQASAAKRVADEETRVRTVLVKVVDELHPLGHPRGDAVDVISEWRLVLAWVAAQLSARTETKRGLDLAAAGAKAAWVEAEGLAAAAALEKEADEAAHQEAIAEAAGGRAQHTSELHLLSQLEGSLVGSQPQAEILSSLAALLVLEESAKAAAADVGKQRAAKAVSQKAAAELDIELAQARMQWSSARDALVPLGAPPAGQDSIADCWTELVAWAGSLAQEHERQLAEDKAARAQIAGELAERETSLRAEFANYGVEGPVTTPAQWVRVELAREQAAAAGAVTSIQDTESKIVTLLTQVETARGEAAVASKLGQLLRVDGLPKWLTANALQVLVTAASETLLNLSAGQFELTSDETGFLVIDRHDTDSIRGVKTLSGGETFQAALALALALSSQLGALSASASAQLEAIFIDEGFGTLDEATLDVVASTLEELASTGGRMVGLITHVPALADRVPVRYQVKRDATGSHVERESR